MSRVDELKTVQDWESYLDSFAANLAPVVHDTGEYKTYTDESPRVHPEQTAWARQMRKQVYMPVEGRVYVAVGYELCSVTMIVGDDGVIVIDPGENDDECAAAWADLRRFRDLPVKAVVYTHRHADHCFAIAALGVTEEDVASGAVKVIGHETFLAWMINDASVIGPILSLRTSLTGFAGHGIGDRGVIHGALGPSMLPGPTSTYLPNVTVSAPTELTVAGVRMVVFPAYGDAQDEIDVYFPDLRHVHGSETIQGESFPNLYTLRGTAYRDFEQWYKGVDALLGYAREADTYSGSHMRPWVGNDFIVERITNYRDAIQFVHDQSVRHMNHGATGQELVGLVADRLPDHLRDDPWLQPYYGTPQHAVREIYVGMLGWYTADPTELAAPLHRDKARRYVDALGGRDAVVERARSAVDAEDWGWAMELLTHVIRIDTDDEEARRLKAHAMREWGYRQKNIYWRNQALGGATELEDAVDYSKLFDVAPADVIKVLPLPRLVEALRVRLDPAKAADARLTIGFEFPDSGEAATLEVRRGVAVFHDGLLGDPAATLVLPGAVAAAVLLGGVDPLTAVDDGRASLRGDRSAAQRFLSFLEDPQPPAKLVAR